MQPTSYWNPENESETTPMYTPTPESEDDQLSQDEKRKYERPGAVSDPSTVHWNATEYIHEEKNALWYFVFMAAVLGMIITDVLWVKSYTFSALVTVMAVSLFIYSRRPPRTVDYTLSGDQGLYIGEVLHHFSEFKAFGVIQDGQHNSIVLVPVKRFSPSVSAYFPDEVGEKLVDILGARLPMHDMKLDLIDIFLRKIRL